VNPLSDKVRQEIWNILHAQIEKQGYSYNARISITDKTAPIMGPVWNEVVRKVFAQAESLIE
jgi:hypothetical protein